MERSNGTPIEIFLLGGCNCNEQPSKATANHVSGKACSSTKSGLLCYICDTNFTKFQVSNLHITSTPDASNTLHECILPREAILSHYFPPSRRLVQSLGLGTTWARQPRSGSCHYPTAATKCNEQPSKATANPVSGKACSSTKSGLLCYMCDTY